MTKKDRTNLSILIVLLAVLGLTIVLVYRTNQPPTLAAVQPPPAKASTQTNPSPPSNTTGIRLDLVEKSESSEEDVGKKNVFQYQQPRVAPGPMLRPGSNSPGPTPPTAVVTQPVQPPVREGPPPPPPIQLKYQGFVSVSPPGAGMTAVLADDSRHYLVTAGEVLMGRYRIIAINGTSIELEDLQYNRKQILPLVK